MLTLDLNLCPLDTCEEWAEVVADLFDYDPDRYCGRREAWESIDIMKVDGETVGEDWEFMCTCGEPCTVRELQAKVARHVRD